MTRDKSKDDELAKLCRKLSDQISELNPESQLVSTTAVSLWMLQEIIGDEEIILEVLKVMERRVKKDMNVKALTSCKKEEEDTKTIKEGKKGGL